MGESKRRRQHRPQFPNEPTVIQAIPAWKLIEAGKRAALTAGAGVTACPQPKKDEA